MEENCAGATAEAGVDNIERIRGWRLVLMIAFLLFVGWMTVIGMFASVGWVCNRVVDVFK
jgi:hypothetical protein